MALTPDIKHIKSASALLAALAVIGLAACGGSSPDPTPTVHVGVTPTVITGSTLSTTLDARATSTAAPSGRYGQLDTTFGDEGKVVTDLGSGLEEVRGIAIQSDGKIVAVGESWPEPDEQPRFAMVRYNKNGTLDTSFGNKGIVITNINGRADANAVAIQPDGKIVVAGQGKMPDVYHPVFALARYNSTGRLDTSFGKNGIVTTDFADRPEEGSALGVAIQPDGKIVAVGSVGPYIYSHDLAVARYNKNGTPDTSFGKKGQYLYANPTGEAIARAVAFQSDGKLLVAGNVSPGGGNDNFAVLRLTTKGKLDTTFGDKGVAQSDMLGGTDWAYGVSVTDKGKILLGGLAQVYCNWQCEKYGFGLSQYNADGTPDTSFGDKGAIFYDFISPSGASAMARRSDGKIVLGGHFGNDEFAIALFNANGKLDTTFGDGGLVRTDFGPVSDRVNAISFDKNGNIVAGGRVVPNPDELLEADFGLARYIAPPVR